RTIMLRQEQGFGDLIQFVRYAPILKALGATVWLHVRSGITELARGFAGVDRVFEFAESIPEFDYYIHLMSLPHVFGTELANIPTSVPYVDVGGGRIEKWTRRLGDDSRLNVGLVWAGHPNHYNDRHRS